jgi:hypothetical protein
LKEEAVSRAEVVWEFGGPDADVVWQSGMSMSSLVGLFGEVVLRTVMLNDCVAG